jgi:hypothetical protein
MVDPKKPFPVFLIAGVGSGLVAGGLAALAANETGNMRAADDLEDLQRAFGRQIFFGSASYTLMGVAALGITIHVAF